MPSAATIRSQVESALAAKIPSALSPQARLLRPQWASGNEAVDRLLDGGLPVGAITELVGAECTGRTSLALSLMAQLTQASKVCAWVDASNAFDPVSATGVGVDLKRLLWVRCGISATPTKREARFTLPAKYLVAAPPRKGLHGGGFGPHPRMEVRGMSKAMTGLFSGAEPQQKPLTDSRAESSAISPNPIEPLTSPQSRHRRAKHYDAIERALRSTDLLLQTGGFSSIVLDLASLPAEPVTRIELSTWHRYRVAAEKMQVCFLLLTQHPCAKSGSELQLRLSAVKPTRIESTVFCGLTSHLAVERHRFARSQSNVVPMRKPVESERGARWQNRTAWAGAR